jgi:hypothetical protein
LNLKFSSLIGRKSAKLRLDKSTEQLPVVAVPLKRICGLCKQIVREARRLSFKLKDIERDENALEAAKKQVQKLN